MAGLRAPRVWLLLAWSDLEARYRRTILGTFWQTLTMASYIVGLAVVFATIRGRDLHDYLLYIAGGFTAWSLIAGLLADGASTFGRGSALLRAYDLPASVHVFRNVLNQYILFAHALGVMALVMVYVGQPPNLNTFLIIPSIVLIFVLGVGISFSVGMLGARFRDVEPALGMVLSFMFITTPIFWAREDLRDKVWIADYNPFYHVVELIRAPLLGEQPAATSWLAVLGLTVLTLVAGVLGFVRYRRQLAHWL